MDRITKSQLQSVVDSINKITGSPMTPYTVNPDTGKHTANIGNYHLSGAYGGFCLHRMYNDGGGVTSPLSTGHISKRELIALMYAFMHGMNHKV